MAESGFLRIPETPNLLIPWPTVRPYGVFVTAEGVKEAWDAYIAPLADDGPQPIELRVLMGVVRAVYVGMHGVVRDV